MERAETKRASMPLFASRLTCGVAAAVVCLTVATPAAAGELTQVARARPAQSALGRLARYDRYIDYFSSLRYGPTSASTSGAYIRALVMTESAANARALSHKGARGLTQIMPETGRRMAAEIASSGVDYDFVDESKLAAFRPEYLYEPAINILIACHLSAKYDQRYGGRTDLVASAWNAGPHAVKRYGNRPPPYPETRGLLERLHGYMTFFQNGHAPSWSVQRWDTAGFDAPGWDLDYGAAGWDIGWDRPKKPTRKRY